jgi:hypothetical protein
MTSPKRTRSKPPDVAATAADPWQQPPAGASALALRWYHDVMQTYAITDMDGRMTLHAIVRSFDRAERCRELIEAQGEVVTGRDGQVRVHPLCAAERDARAAMMQALRHLDIGVLAPTVRPGRPPGHGN